MTTFVDLLTELEPARVTLYQELRPTNQSVVREAFIAQTMVNASSEDALLHFDWKQHAVENNINLLNEMWHKSYTVARLKKHERKALRYLINAYLKQNQLLAVVQEINSSTEVTAKQKATLRKLNEEIFGEIDQNVFMKLSSMQMLEILTSDWSKYIDEKEASYQAGGPFELPLIFNFHNQLHKLQLKKDAESAEAYYAMVREQNGEPTNSTEADKQKSRPSEEYNDFDELCLPGAKLDRLLTDFRQTIEYQFGQVMELIPKQEIYTPEEVCDIMNQIFQHAFCKGTAFRAEISETLSTLESDQERKVLVIPRHRTAGEYTYDVMLGKVFGHEFCGHIYRRIVCENGDLQFLGRGLPGYETFEEGLARLIDQALTGKLDTKAYDHYINAGYAEFVHCDFADIYYFRLGLDYFRKCKPDDSSETKQNQFARSQKLAFDQAVRALRGTGIAPCYKDITYTRGDLLARRYIAAQLQECEGDFADSKRLMQNHILTDALWRSGKIDCGNRKHVQIAEQFKKASRPTSDKFQQQITAGM